MQVLVDEKGKIVETRTLIEDKSPELDLGFGQAASQALSQAVWEPALKDGKPTKAWTIVPVLFRIP